VRRNNLPWTMVLWVVLVVSFEFFDRDAQSQSYPSRPLRLVVPYPPSGANDTIARLIGPKVSQTLGQSLVIDNRGGANTIIGTELVAKADPDGYTLLIVAAGHTVNPALYPKLPYNTEKDFTEVVLIGDGAYVLVTHPNSGFNSLSELIAIAKAKPGELLYASSSIGNLTHLAAELFNSMAGIKMLHVPYKGGGPAMLDVLGGRIPIYFSTVAVARPQIYSGKVKALGVTTAHRSAALPNVPTINEAGLPGYELSGWYGIVAPAKTPPLMIEILNQRIRDVLRQSAIKDKLMDSGVEATDQPAAFFAKRIHAELLKWEKVLKPLAIKPE